MSQRLWHAALVVICLGLVSCSTGFPKLNSGSGAETIAASNGTPQSHGVGGVFASPLVALVTMNGAPASGVSVTFKAPATGASGTFADTGTAVTTATTDASGLATAAAFAANGTAGSYSVVASMAAAAGSASFNLTNTTGSPSSLQVTSGGSQSAGLNSAFAPLTVTVVDVGNNPVQNTVVVFQAPASGASGTFADTGTNKTTATTNAKGVATASLFRSNTVAGADPVTAMAAGVSTSVTFNLTNLAASPTTIVAASGNAQRAVINTAFAAPLTATVFDSYSNPVGGVQVTFSAPTTSASGIFANGITTETDITNASGVAASTVFSANGTTGGPYTVTAAVAGVATAADFSLTNTLPFKTYVFFLSGEEVNTGAFYALAGSVQIDTSGNVVAGEQDYNDGLFGLTSPEPSGDTITGGTLKANTNGQGTLTLNTNNPSVGAGGIETLGVQFVNLSHALIVQFDGVAATASGTLDVQTLPTSLSGGYAFTLSGTDPNFYPVAFGGVFNISGGTNLNGVFDTNDADASPQIVTDASLSGTLSGFDAFGRGTISSTINYTQLVGTAAPVVLNYYVVGPEVLRIIDVDSANNGGLTSDTAIGSAFGQGANATSASNGSLGPCVFGIGLGLAGGSLSNFYAAAGMLSPSASSGTFTGFGDEDEILLIGSPVTTSISGNYSIASNGYGTLTISPGSFGDVSALGLYMTDPKLNLSDPNNTTTGLGGALVADMDGALAGGTGFLIPQTDPSSTSFKGKYAFGGQAYAFLNATGEFDFVGGGTVTNGVLNGTFLVSDPFLTFAPNPTNSGVKFEGTPFADPSNPGRYTLSSSNPTPNPLQVTIKGVASSFDLAIYQASGGELIWINEDSTSIFLGSLQQKGSLTGLP